MLGFILALISVILLQFGYIFQKIGLNDFIEIFSINKKAGIKSEAFQIWFSGTLLTTLGSIIFFYSLTLGNLSVLQPLQGLGPLIIVILGIVILKDKLLKFEWIGIILSTVGLLILPLFSQLQTTEANIDELTVLLVSFIIFVFTILLGYFIQHWELLEKGIIEGIIAGLLAGYASIFAKIGIPPLIGSLTIHWAIITLIICQLMAFILLQRGFALGNVAKIASIFTSISILNPVLYGIFFFEEPFHIFQGMGILFILIGAILLSKKSQFEVN
ncbi:MAG: EamA family transporter [Candidatus Hodarchaeales archaeon]